MKKSVLKLLPFWNLWISPLLIIGGFLAVLSTASANTYTVNTTVDHPVSGGVNPATGVITGGAGNGLVSLRSAIIASNANVGADIITLGNGTYLLSITSGGSFENSAMTGDLDINGSLTINGNGPTNTIISTNYTSTCGDCKVFGVNQTGDFPSLTVSINGVTIQNGFNNGAAFQGTFFETGGGIDFYLNGANTAYSMTNCVVTNNQVTGSIMSHGGGINVDGAFQISPGGLSAGTVTFTNVSVTNNMSSTFGAGIVLAADKHDVTMNNCTITGNIATEAGGGMWIRHSYGGTINIMGGSISNNSGSQGGGINNAGNQVLIINNTIIDNNIATGAGTGVPVGGGIAISNLGAAGVTGSTSLTGVTISNNHADTEAGAEGGGVYFNANYPATLTNCTITGNTSITGAGVQNAGSGTNGMTLTISGGAITNNIAAGSGGGVSHTGPMTVTNISNATITGNTAANHGGGMYITGGTINLQKNAIASNTANSDNAGGGEGGGIYNGGGSITFNYNRIALNVANGSAASNAFRQVSGTVTNIQNNWWGTNSPATVINGTAAFTPYLQLAHTAASNSICPNTSTGLTASFVLNSAGTNVLANIDRLIGLPITFGNATPAGSNISAAQTTIQANGTATATFNAGATPGAGGANATVDNFAVNAAITVLASPNVTLQPMSQSVCIGNPVSFTSTATGNPSPSRQWQKSTNGGMSFQDILGETGMTLAFSGMYADNGNQYRAVYTNTCAVVNSNAATLTVHPSEDPSFDYGKNAYCQLGTDPLPTIYGTPGGIFSAPVALSINTATGQIDVSASTAGGPYTVTYNTDGPCPQTSMVNVTIVNCAPGATLMDMLVIDNPPMGSAGVGDRIQLKATITNMQAADYEGMQLSMNSNPDVTFVPGSFKSTPVAVDDAYTAILNTQLNVLVGSGLLQNDFDDNIPGLAVTAFSAMSAQGGTVSVNANGSFTYNPPNGFTGNDTFTYTITDSDMQTNSGTVKIRVQ